MLYWILIAIAWALCVLITWDTVTYLIEQDLWHYIAGSLRPEYRVTFNDYAGGHIEYAIVAPFITLVIIASLIRGTDV